MTTTTREAALEAAAKNLVWAAQTSGGTAGRDEGLVAACDRMEAALSTPATEPQGYHGVSVRADTVTRPAPQPAADTRVVSAFPPHYDGGPLGDGYLKTITAYFKPDEAEHAMAAEVLRLRAIIGTATPAPSDKIAEAAIDRCMQEIEDIICEADVSYPAGRDAGTSIDFDRDAVLAALRALAGKGE